MERGLEPMKIVLTDEVENLGIAGDVREVKDGYARNYLLPQNLAVMATKTELASADSRRKVEVQRRTTLNVEVEGLVEGLQEQPLVMEVRVGPAGRLYGSVTAAEIAQAVGERIGKELDRHAVDLPQPIREVSDREVRVRLAPDVFATLNVSVQPEGGLPPSEDSPTSDSVDETVAEPTIEEAIAAEEVRMAEETAEAEEDQSRPAMEATEQLGEPPTAELDQPAAEATAEQDDAPEDDNPADDEDEERGDSSKD